MLLACFSACQFDPSVPVLNRDSGAGDDSGRPGSDAVMATDASPCDMPTCGWAYRRALSIDVARISSSLTDIPVLIVLDEQRIRYGATLPGGADLRFYSQDLVLLAHDIERWDASDRSFIWVRVPEMAPDAQPLQLWMYYGNPSAPDGQDPGAVWSNDFVSVHHLSGNYRDSTAAHRDGAPSDSLLDVTGPSGRAFYFNGVGDYIELPDESAYDFGDQLSASLWFRVESFTYAWQALLTKGDRSWRLARSQINDHLSFGTTDNDGSHTNHNGSQSVDDDSWHHALITYDGTRAEIYVDGVLDVSNGYSESISNTNSRVLIGENSQMTGRWFHGSLDEVRIAATPRSADWALVEYLTVADDTFISVGPEEAL